ncbi:MAG: alpha/beta fold hydrolase [Verrucomicrobia bacterium]|nr:MAG: alpha/beta fold hydrolase [Verrucomicrobiota bacterium]
MPLVAASDYRPPALLRDGHSSTLFATLSRRLPALPYQRQRLDLHDGDFIDIDWSRVGSRRLVVVSHGLEGNSGRPYVVGMVRAFNRAGWDAAAWNFRGCSGELNRTLTFTHSGASGDLAAVVAAACATGRYDAVALVGFSLGGNLTLKYLGELGDDVPSAVRAAVVFSVPCDLEGSASRMGDRANWVYMRRFLAELRGRIEAKAAQFPGRVSLEGFARIRTFREFDERYTAPLHGFGGALDYWTRSSSKAFVGGIRRPTLLVNAMDDPFLVASCFPREEAVRSEWLHLEAPEAGGHVGFVTIGNDGEYWSETRAVGFAGQHAGPPGNFP